MSRVCHYCGSPHDLVCEIVPLPRPGSVARFYAQVDCAGCGLAGPLAGGMTPGEAQRSAWLLWDGLPVRLAVTSAGGGQ